MQIPKSSIENNCLQVEGESQIFRRVEARSFLLIDITLNDLKFFGGYSTDGAIMSEYSRSQAVGILNRSQKVAIAGVPQLTTTKFVVGIERLKASHEGEWHAQLSFYPRDERFPTEEDWWVGLYIPEAPYNDIRQSVLSGLAKTLRVRCKLDAWVEDGASFGSGEYVTWYLEPDPKFGKRASGRIEQIDWQFESPEGPSILSRPS